MIEIKFDLTTIDNKWNVEAEIQIYYAKLASI